MAKFMCGGVVVPSAPHPTYPRLIETEQGVDEQGVDVHNTFMKLFSLF